MIVADERNDETSFEQKSPYLKKILKLLVAKLGCQYIAEYLKRPERINF